LRASFRLRRSDQRRGGERHRPRGVEWWRRRPSRDPTGVQIAARPYDDVSAFRIGAALERVRPWPQIAEPALVAV